MASIKYMQTPEAHSIIINMQLLFKTNKAAQLLVHAHQAVCNKLVVKGLPMRCYPAPAAGRAVHCMHLLLLPPGAALCTR